MDIGIFGAIIFVALELWMPLFVTLAFLALVFAQSLPIKGSKREKLSKSIFGAGVLFVPSEIFIMKIHYSNSGEPVPPFWFFVLYGLAGFLVFFIWSSIAIKNKEN